MEIPFGKGRHHLLEKATGRRELVIELHLLENITMIHMERILRGIDIPVLQMVLLLILIQQQNTAVAERTQVPMMYILRVLMENTAILDGLN